MRQCDRHPRPVGGLGAVDRPGHRDRRPEPGPDDRQEARPRPRVTAAGPVIPYSYPVDQQRQRDASPGRSPWPTSKATDEACPATPTSLAPDASITCTASYTVTQAELDAGGHERRQRVRKLHVPRRHEPDGRHFAHRHGSTIGTVPGPALTIEKSSTTTR